MGADFLRRLQSAMEDRAIHVYIAIVMELFNALKSVNPSESPEYEQCISLLYLSLRPIAPETAKFIAEQLSIDTDMILDFSAELVELIFIKGSKKISKIKVPK